MSRCLYVCASHYDGALFPVVLSRVEKKNGDALTARGMSYSINTSSYAHPHLAGDQSNWQSDYHYAPCAAHQVTMNRSFIPGKPPVVANDEWWERGMLCDTSGCRPRGSVLLPSSRRMRPVEPQRCHKGNCQKPPGHLKGAHRHMSSHGYADGEWLLGLYQYRDPITGGVIRYEADPRAKIPVARPRYLCEFAHRSPERFYTGQSKGCGAVQTPWCNFRELL